MHSMQLEILCIGFNITKFGMQGNQRWLFCNVVVSGVTNIIMPSVRVHCIQVMRLKSKILL